MQQAVATLAMTAAAVSVGSSVTRNKQQLMVSSVIQHRLLASKFTGLKYTRTTKHNDVDNNGNDDDSNDDDIGSQHATITPASMQ